MLEEHDHMGHARRGVMVGEAGKKGQAKNFNTITNWGVCRKESSLLIFYRV